MRQISPPTGIRSPDRPVHSLVPAERWIIIFTAVQVFCFIYYVQRAKIVISLVHNAPSIRLRLHTHTPRSRAEAGEAAVATCSLLLSTYQIKGTSAAPCLLPTDTQLRLHTTTGRAVHLSIDLSISLVHTERCVIYCNLMLVCHSPILISYQRHVPQPAYKMKQGKYTVSKISLKENYI